MKTILFLLLASGAFAETPTASPTMTPTPTCTPAPTFPIPPVESGSVDLCSDGFYRWQTAYIPVFPVVDGEKLSRMVVTMYNPTDRDMDFMYDKPGYTCAPAKLLAGETASYYVYESTRVQFLIFKGCCEITWGWE